MVRFSKLLCGQGTVSDALKGNQNGMLVVWNITSRCNLNCKHCYLTSEDRDYSGELTTEEAKNLIDELARVKVSVLLLSGGEPLVREDILELGEYAAGQGLRVGLSSNGTLITEEVAKKLRESGFVYVGVSLDGLEKTHDSFRRIDGSFEATLKGMRNALKAGIKVGIRFTLTKLNSADLPKILKLTIQEKIPRFCLYHLVYAGRGKNLIGVDLNSEERRRIVNFLIEKTLEVNRRGIDLEILTTDNHADGVLIYHYVEERMPERAEDVQRLLQMHGGCSAGTKICSISSKGDVHLCQFWSHQSIGNVRRRSLSSIWIDEPSEILKRTRRMAEHLKGRCGICQYKELCGGCRIRAEAINNDPWMEDPACYLRAEEIK